VRERQFRNYTLLIRVGSRMSSMSRSWPTSVERDNATSVARTLLSLGVDSETSESIATKFASLTALRKLSDIGLSELGLTADQVDGLRKKRPPIPSDVLFRVLHESRRTCAVCRDGRSVIVHHIQPWAMSQSHDEKNLVVLCTSCHDKAHTRHDLSKNLTAEEISEHKRLWLDHVRKRDIDRIFCPTFLAGGGFFDYFNYTRLDSLFRNRDIAADCSVHFAPLRSLGLVSTNGELCIGSDTLKGWRVQHVMPPQHEWLQRYYSDRLKRLLQETRWVDLGANWKKKPLALLCESEMLYVDSGAYFFRCPPLKRGLQGPGQPRLAYRKARGIRLEGLIDAYDAQSTSAYYLHLRGCHRTTSIGVIRGTRREAGSLVLDATYLAFGMGIAGSRSHPPEDG
jgi:hypothetical protein